MIQKTSSVTTKLRPLSNTCPFSLPPSPRAPQVTLIHPVYPHPNPFLHTHNSNPAYPSLHRRLSLWPSRSTSLSSTTAARSAARPWTLAPTTTAAAATPATAAPTDRQPGTQPSILYHGASSCTSGGYGGCVPGSRGSNLRGRGFLIPTTGLGLCRRPISPLDRPRQVQEPIDRRRRR